MSPRKRFRSNYLQQIQGGYKIIRIRQRSYYFEHNLNCILDILIKIYIWNGSEIKMDWIYIRLFMIFKYDLNKKYIKLYYILKYIKFLLDEWEREVSMIKKS